MTVLVSDRRRAVLALLALSLGLRVAWFAVGPAAIESEGAYYARVGENLARGRGYVGIREAGLQILYPPLYPASIALGVRAGLPAETAGRLVSLLFGSVFPLLALALARALYGERAGWFAGLLAAVHPLLVALSAAVLTESVYLTLLLAAILLTVRSLTSGSARAAAGAGLVLGLAYWTRPEALALAGAFAFVLAASRMPGARGALARGAAAAVAFLGVALLYAVPLSLHVGAFRLEAKSPESVAFLRRHWAGESETQIYFSVDSDLRDTGISNVSNLDMIRNTAPASPGERWRLALPGVKRNLPRFFAWLLVKRSLGVPVLSLLAALGFLSAGFTRRRIWLEAPLLAVVLLNLVTFSSWPYLHERFIFPVLVPGVVWAGAGLAVLRDRLPRRWGAPLGGAGRYRGAEAIALALVVATSAWGVSRADEVSESWARRNVAARRIGERLRADLGDRLRLTDTQPTIAYYAGAVLVPFPWTDAETAVRYLDARRPDLVVVRRSAGPSLPYARSWFENGVPLGSGTELGAFDLGDDEARIFRWSAPGGPGGERLPPAAPR